MSRKASRNTGAPAKVAPKSASHDRPPGYRPSTKNKTRTDRHNKDCADNRRQIKLRLGGDTSRNSSLDDQAEADVSDADSAGKDGEEDDDDAESDAFAPPGRSFEGHKDQAGLTKNGGDDFEAGRKRKRNATAAQEGDRVVKRGRCPKPDNNLKGEHDSDEDYNAVDLISNSDEEDAAVEELEEKNIIESEELFNTNALANHFPGGLSETGTWKDFGLDEGLFLGDIPYFDEQYGRTEPSFLSSEMDFFKSASVFEGFFPSSQTPQESSSPRVRFKEPLHAQSDPSDIVSNDEDISSLFNPSQPQPSLNSEVDHTINYQDNDSSRGSLSGYETDYGDTTDEEDVPASATKAPQSLLRHPSMSSLVDTAQCTPTSLQSPLKSSAAPPGYRRGPRMGSFKTDLTKPVVMADSTGERILIYAPKRPGRLDGSPAKVGGSRTSTALTSPISSQPMISGARDDSEIEFRGFSSQLPVSIDTMLGSGASESSTAQLNDTRDEPFGGHPFADSSVFAPADSIPEFTALYGSDEDAGGEDDVEPFLNIRDFVHFSEDSSDNDSGGVNGQSEIQESMAQAANSNAAAPSTLQLKTPSPNSPSNPNSMKRFDTSGPTGAQQGPPRQQRLRHPQSGLSLAGQAFTNGKPTALKSPLNHHIRRKLSGSFGSHPLRGGFITKRKIMNHH